MNRHIIIGVILLVAAVSVGLYWKFNKTLTSPPQKNVACEQHIDATSCENDSRCAIFEAPCPAGLPSCTNFICHAK